MVRVSTVATLHLRGTSWRSGELFLALCRVPGTHIPSFFEASYKWVSRQRLAFQRGPAGGMDWCQAKTSTSTPGFSFPMACEESPACSVPGRRPVVERPGVP